MTTLSFTTCAAAANATATATAVDSLPASPISRAFSQLMAERGVAGDSSSAPSSPTDGGGGASPRDLDLDDGAAGNDFDSAALHKRAADAARDSLHTRFCSFRKAQVFARELRLAAADHSSQFQGVVTQLQVFEACMRHHYAVPLPPAYEEDITRALCRAFPLEAARHQAHIALDPASGRQGGAVVGFGAAAGGGGSNSRLSGNLADSDATGAAGSSGHAAADDARTRATSVFNAGDAGHLLELIRLQAWWRGMRFARVVRRATAQARALRDEGGSAATEAEVAGL